MAHLDDTVAQLAKSDSVLAKGSTIGAPPTRERQTVERGDRIGRYVVLDLVGSGAVYAAHDADLDRKVAVKLLHRGAAASEAERARMFREAQALARIADRGVVAVHDVGTHDEQIYIAMEFVTGGTRKAWLGQGAAHVAPAPRSRQLTTHPRESRGAIFVRPNLGARP